VDDQRFDAFVRAAATAPTRRRVLAMLVASAVSSIFPRSPASAAPRAACDPSAPGDGGCGGGLACCLNQGGPVCADLSSSPFNCGVCSNFCASGVCNNGVCGGGETGCSIGLTQCGDAGNCVDLSSDPNNCGTCFNACPSGTCSGGICVPGADECPPGLTLCGTAGELLGCFDLSSDLNNCGACFNVCQSGLVSVACRGGQCVRADCPPELTYCGAVDLCRDLSTDPLHCGGCGTACASGVCTAGVCADTGCGPGLVDCGGVCVKLSSNRANCGTCGFICAQGADCLSGQCLCRAGLTYCEGLGACLDFSADPSNCGGCGVVCAAGETCRAGVCQAPPKPTATPKPASKPARTPSTPPDATLSWPFALDEGQWTIINGYRGEGGYALRPDGSPNYFLFALDFARCQPDSVDDGRGRCALADGGLYGEGADQTGWDVEATRGATVLSPVDGTIAWTDTSTPSCLGFAIDVDGAPGYRLALFHVEGYPKSGRVQRGKPIGKVSAKGCGQGDHIEMVLYKPQAGADDKDPVAGRVGVPFAGEWEIDGCAYPDDKRTANQYRGELVPCTTAAPASADA